MEEWPEIRVSISGDSGEKTVVGDALLIAAGRVPNVEGLGLEAAGVDYTPGVGIKVSDDLTTSNPDILAS